MPCARLFASQPLAGLSRASTGPRDGTYELEINRPNDIPISAWRVEFLRDHSVPAWIESTKTIESALGEPHYYGA